MSLSPVFLFSSDEDRHALRVWRDALRAQGRSLVFTNGVFDIVHSGHATYLNTARSLGDALIVGLNSDASVRAIKGPKRPIQTQDDRATLLASMRAIDAVVIFDEETPFDVISLIVPDILVKGGDYRIENIVGRDIVEAHGGKVLPLSFIDGQSTSGIVERILERYTPDSATTK